MRTWPFASLKACMSSWASGERFVSSGLMIALLAPSLAFSKEVGQHHWVEHSYDKNKARYPEKETVCS